MPSYRNPIIRGVNPDPSVCRAGDDYYLATSSFHLVPGVPIYHSRDLIHWRHVGHALTRREHFLIDPAKNRIEIYAPTLRYHDGVFYLTTTNVLGGGNFFVTTRDPAGEWSDAIPIDRDVFDPSFFFDDDGKAYYMRRGPFERKTIVQAEIDIATGNLLGELRDVSKGLISDDTEGPHLYKIDGWYYLLMGEGGSRFLHMATIARARGPWGPFEPCPHNPFLAQHNAWWHAVKSVGHADLVQDGRGDWWCVFLATRHTEYGSFAHLGRETYVVPLEWKDGWPVVKPEHCQKLEVTTTRAVPASPFPMRPIEREDFDGAKPGLAYVGFSPPDKAIATLAARPGHLRLRAQHADLIPGPSCAFVGRRQCDLACTFETTVEFTPTCELDEAGLSVFQKRDYRYDIAVTVRRDQRTAVLRKHVGDIHTDAAELPLADGPVTIALTATHEAYHFTVAQAGQTRPLGSALTRLIASEVADTWAGVMLGLYSVAGDPSTANPADFDYAEYRGTDAPVTA